jgi:transcriptional regulator with XRE-family HTH domain
MNKKNMLSEGKKNISPEPGLRIRRLRKRLKLSRQEFEGLTGVSAHTLRHLETGSQELQPTRARSLAITFIYFFKLPEEEANEHFLLHGNQEDDSA